MPPPEALFECKGDIAAFRIHNFPNRSHCRMGVSKITYSRERLEYCLESAVSEERAHWVLRQTRWVLRETRWVRFGTEITGWKEPCSPKPYSARFRYSHSRIELDQLWKATKEYLNHRGTNIRFFRVCFRTPFLPPFFPHSSPLFPL